jgi:hypothetical protein
MKTTVRAKQPVVWVCRVTAVRALRIDSLVSRQKGKIVDELSSDLGGALSGDFSCPSLSLSASGTRSQ